MTPTKRQSAQCICGSAGFETAFEYQAPPAGEVRFDFSARGNNYYRKIIKCKRCGHMLSVHEMEMSALYQGAYVDSTYGAEGLKANFEKINALPENKSDNIGRVKRVLSFVEKHRQLPAKPKMLDVGSGLCVFGYRMAKAGWDCTALDADPRQAEHACQIEGVSGVCQVFEEGADLGRYHLISFNKVLEHLEDPVGILSCAKGFLEDGGVVYLELPDGLAALTDPDPPEREEFFIEHHHIFSPASLCILIDRSGFQLLEMESLREPSGKYTLRAFAEPLKNF